MKIYKYDSYEDYVEAQTEANVRKLQLVWVRPETVQSIHQRQPFAGTILCHGTRNAAEQKMFKQMYPHADVIGTEISHTAKQFPMTVQLDFHEQKDGWEGNFDIVYSNAFDHAYDPTKCMTTWRDQLSDSGVMYIEAMLGHENRSKRSDPLEISEEELIELANSLGLELKETFSTHGMADKQSKIYAFTK